MEAYTPETFELITPDQRRELMQYIGLPLTGQDRYDISIYKEFLNEKFNHKYLQKWFKDMRKRNDGDTYYYGDYAIDCNWKGLVWVPEKLIYCSFKTLLEFIETLAHNKIHLYFNEGAAL